MNFPLDMQPKYFVSNPKIDEVTENKIDSLLGRKCSEIPSLTEVLHRRTWDIWGARAKTKKKEIEQQMCEQPTWESCVTSHTRGYFTTFIPLEGHPWEHFVTSSPRAYSHASSSVRLDRQSSAFSWMLISAWHVNQLPIKTTSWCWACFSRHNA